MKLFVQVRSGPKKKKGPLPLPTDNPSSKMTHDEEVRVIVHLFNPGGMVALHDDELLLFGENTWAMMLLLPPER